MASKWHSNHEDDDNSRKSLEWGKDKETNRETEKKETKTETEKKETKTETKEIWSTLQSK